VPANQLFTDWVTGDLLTAAKLNQMKNDLAALSGAAFTGTITRAGNTVWDAGNDGAGTGLDADKLDGFNTLTGTVTLAGGTLAAGATTTVSISVPGVVVGSPAVLAVPASWPSSLQFSPYVFAADEVDFAIYNSSGGSVSYPSGDYKALVFTWP
jgi:hypothetical protein